MQALASAVLDSQLFWGVVTLLLAAFAFSPKVPMNMSNVLLGLAWLVGCFGMYRSAMFRDWYILIAACLFFGGALALIAFFIQPALPITSSQPDLRTDNQQTKSPEMPDLHFREVPPEQLTIPKEFMVDVGSNRSMVSYEKMRDRIPLEYITGLQLGPIPLTVHFNDKGEMLVNADIYFSDRKVGAKISNNNFYVSIPDWDRNWDESAFEIIDENNKVVFQITRIKENYLKIRGILWTTTGHKYAIADNGIYGSKKIQEATPTKPLFVYPSAANLHRRVPS